MNIEMVSNYDEKSKTQEWKIYIILSSTTILKCMTHAINLSLYRPIIGLLSLSLVLIMMYRQTHKYKNTILKELYLAYNTSFQTHRHIHTHSHPHINIDHNFVRNKYKAVNLSD